jgi:DNA invertase Pin-like site-specific DNA recombinase
MGQFVGWARVSGEGQDLDGQLDALSAANCEKVFSSKHSGKGKGTNADKLQELISYVREGDIVVVTKLDRLGRSLREVLNTVDTLRDKGVALKALEQPIDTSKDDAFSNAMLQMMGVFAEMERTFIVERTKAGRERTGNYGGRKKTISDDERQQIRELVAAGATQYSLAKRYGVSKQTIHRIVNGR